MHSRRAAALADGDIPVAFTPVGALRSASSPTQSKIQIPFKTKKISYKTALKFAGILEFISKTFLNYKEPVFTKYTVGLLAFSQTLDIQKAKKDLNYKPIKSIQKGVEELVKYNEKTHEYC